MTDRLPLLVFPQATRVAPPLGSGFPPSTHFPSKEKQIQRLEPKLDRLDQILLQNSTAELDPEKILVIEVINTVDDFRQAAEAIGLEWLGEFDTKNIEPDDDFYQPVKIGVDFFKNKIKGIDNREKSKEIQQSLKNCGFIDDKGQIIAEQSLPDDFPFCNQIEQLIESAKKYNKLVGCVFLSFTNQSSMKKMLNLWKKWKKKKNLPHGKRKWEDVFKQTKDMRYWGLKEILGDANMLNHWRNLMEPVASQPPDVTFQIELFYRSNKNKQEQNEAKIVALLQKYDGYILGQFINMPEIAFHAVKATLPASKIQHLIDSAPDDIPTDTDIDLFKFSGLMYIRPTGQSIPTVDSDDAIITKTLNFPEEVPTQPPVAMILDGAPNLHHKALKNRIELGDPDLLNEKYLHGERQHGTQMASLIALGDMSNPKPLNSKVYHTPIMQPDPTRNRNEGFLDEVFFEDRIHKAVKRIFDSEDNMPAQAPTIKIINISLGDSDRPFTHTLSPWARLLDWLSWEYRVLFCVSAGNYNGAINIDLSSNHLLSITNEEKVKKTLNYIKENLFERRILSPAESINALTIGALHTDASGEYDLGNRVDLLPNDKLPSPISRFGHGFRRSIKPEILFPGGQQLYDDTPINDNYSIAQTSLKPGQKVACDSKQIGTISEMKFTSGTSNATALATRGGVKIYEMLTQLQTEHPEKIPDNLMSILIKTLLIHGAKQNSDAQKLFDEFIRPNNHNAKEARARYLGYGSVNIERVLACTEQRGTVISCGEISENEAHEYKFPLPQGLSASREWRRMTVTLTWFAPINPYHRHIREAKLEFKSKEYNKTLKTERQDCDWRQVTRGTVQHEVFEGEKQLNQFQQDQEIVLQVICKKDATEKLEDLIPYGIAVTLEVAENVDIPIYQQIKQKIQPQIIVGNPVES